MENNRGGLFGNAKEEERMERGNKTAGGGGRGGRRKKKKRRDRYELRNIIGLSYDRDCVVSV